MSFNIAKANNRNYTLGLLNAVFKDANKYNFFFNRNKK